MRPLVSIIVPTYNRAELLRQTVASVLAQSYPAIELIVVDDGSTDGTAELLAGYGRRITVLRKQNGGGTAARNSGIALAQGAYVGFLDHDDLLLPEKIARQVDLLERRPELGAAHCRWHFIDGEGRQIDTIGALPEGDLLAPLALGCFIWSGGPLVRRQVLEQVGLFDPAIWSSDWDMWLRIAQAGHRFGCVQEPLGCYRILADSTMADVARTERCDIRIFDKLFGDSALPPAVAALRAEALANWRFWLGRRYYAIGAEHEGKRQKLQGKSPDSADTNPAQDHSLPVAGDESFWEDARRNFGEALRLRPELLADRAGLRRALVNEALDVRVSDPLGYIAGVLAHLPAEAATLAEDATLLRSLVLAGRGLRGMAFASRQKAKGKRQKVKGKMIYRVAPICNLQSAICNPVSPDVTLALAQAQEDLRAAVGMRPGVVDAPGEFLRLAHGWAMRLGAEPDAYLEAIFAGLPAEARALRRLRGRLAGDIRVGRAFEAYQSGRRRRAAWQMLGAVGRRPGYLGNRGVLAVLLRGAL